MKGDNLVYYFGGLVGAFATLVAMLIAPISRTEATYAAWFFGSVILIIIIYAIIKGENK